MTVRGRLPVTSANVKTSGPHRSRFTIIWRRKKRWMEGPSAGWKEIRIVESQEGSNKKRKERRREGKKE